MIINADENITSKERIQAKIDDLVYWFENHALIHWPVLAILVLVSLVLGCNTTVAHTLIAALTTPVLLAGVYSALLATLRTRLILGLSLALSIVTLLVCSMLTVYLPLEDMAMRTSIAGFVTAILLQVASGNSRLPSSKSKFLGQLGHLLLLSTLVHVPLTLVGAPLKIGLLIAFTCTTVALYDNDRAGFGLSKLLSLYACMIAASTFIEFFFVWPEAIVARIIMSIIMMIQASILLAICKWLVQTSQRLLRA